MNTQLLGYLITVAGLTVLLGPWVLVIGGVVLMAVVELAEFVKGLRR